VWVLVIPREGVESYLYNTPVRPLMWPKHFHSYVIPREGVERSFTSFKNSALLVFGIK